MGLLSGRALEAPGQSNGSVSAITWSAWVHGRAQFVKSDHWLPLTYPISIQRLPLCLSVILHDSPGSVYHNFLRIYRVVSCTVVSCRVVSRQQHELTVRTTRRSCNKGIRLQPATGTGIIPNSTTGQLDSLEALFSHNEANKLEA